jgi:hypothetical protein
MSSSKLRGTSRDLGRSQVSIERPDQPAPALQDGDVRDRIINMYKDEIKMHSARDRDFQHLEALIDDLTRRSKLLEASLSDTQREYEDRING